MLERFHCKRCCHSWIPRTEGKPVQCPKCRNPLWDKEYVRPDLVYKNKVK